MPNRYNNIDFVKTFASMPPDIIDLMQKREEEQNARDFALLCEGLQHGMCYLCGKSIDEVDPQHPCLHWMISNNAKKRDILALLNGSIGLVKLYTYLAWVANTLTPLININDKMSDTFDNRMFEGTIRYKEYEWSFSLGNSDFEGHKGSFDGEQSHYHMQIFKNGRILLKFNDAHIKLQPDDLLYIEMVRQGAAKIDPLYSSGMNELEVNSKELSRHMTPAINDNSYFRTRTYIDTRTVNEDILNEIRDVMQAQNVTIANAIEYLTGIEIKDLDSNKDVKSIFKLKTPYLPSELSSRLLNNRPDVLMAEFILASSDEMLKKARKDFLPDFNLDFNFSAIGLHNFTQYLFFGGIGASVLTPIFKGGELDGKFDMANAERMQAAYIYRDVVIKAYQESKDSYASIKYLNLELKSAKYEIKELESGLKHIKDRYKEGYCSYLEVINSKYMLLQKKLENISLKNSININLYIPTSGIFITII